MQKWLNAALLALLFSTPLALANAASSEEALTGECLKYGLEAVKDNPGFQTRLKGLTPERDSIIVERSDAKVGSQHIATQLTATLEDKLGEPLNMLCLLENDAPLYVYFYE